MLCRSGRAAAGSHLDAHNSDVAEQHRGEEYSRASAHDAGSNVPYTEHRVQGRPPMTHEQLEATLYNTHLSGRGQAERWPRACVLFKGLECYIFQCCLTFSAVHNGEAVPRCCVELM